MAETDPRDFDEVDHDFDDDNDYGDPEPGEPGPAERTPSIIIDDVHVKYRVFGGKKKSVGPEMGRIKRFFNRSRGHVGAVNHVHAVRGVSFVAHHGESVGLIGMNGAGKSTLLRAMAGLIPPSSGSVYTAGTSSLLGVNAALMKSLTGERNVMIGGLALGLSPQEVRDRFDEIVDFAGIGDFIHMPMSAYSSGMAARLRFAISTVATPDVLMIDEALATGDAEFKKRSQERVKEIRKNAGTVFLVSHSMNSIKAMCERVIWIDKGQMKADGPVDEVIKQYRQALKRRS
ncbi:ABC transporter ATP-binding protein [Pseudactinotalea sp. Z1748]|uniref:ABC transporter ATP-binding protein n=1 Tax=Pseudactinotalea sp. Z1748 TaxID=3413027 RepID=UPI003C7E894E